MIEGNDIYTKQRYHHSGLKSTDVPIDRIRDFMKEGILKRKIRIHDLDLRNDFKFIAILAKKKINTDIYKWLIGKDVKPK